MRKRLLLWTTVLLMLVGIGFAMVPFGRAMNPSPESRNNSTIIIPLPHGLTAGVPQQFRIDGHPLIVLKPTQDQWQDIRRLDPYVWDQSTPAWNVEIGAFAYWGIGTRFGHELETAPAPDSDLTTIYALGGRSEYLFPAGAKPVWFGGYWNSNEEVSYDYAGRSIRDRLHTYSGESMSPVNLTPARVKLIEPEKLAVYLYPDQEKNN